MSRITAVLVSIVNMAVVPRQRLVYETPKRQFWPFYETCFVCRCFVLQLFCPVYETCFAYRPKRLHITWNTGIQNMCCIPTRMAIIKTLVYKTWLAWPVLYTGVPYNGRYTRYLRHVSYIGQMAVIGNSSIRNIWYAKPGYWWFVYRTCLIYWPKWPF